MYVIVKDYGFVLNEEEIKELFLKNEKLKEEYIKSQKNSSDYEFMLDNADEIGFVRYCTDDNGFVLYKFESNDEVDFDYGMVFLLELKRDSLFQRYSDYKEIYIEIWHNLKEQGFEVDLDYVKQHCGKLEGVEWYD